MSKCHFLDKFVLKHFLKFLSLTAFIVINGWVLNASSQRRKSGIFFLDETNTKVYRDPQLTEKKKFRVLT